MSYQTAPEIYIHTAKAVKKGHPASRVFLAVHISDAIDSTTKTAWKCEIEGDKIWHPFYRDELLSPNEFLTKGNIVGEGDCVPSAYFVPDSFYQKITLDELKVFIGRYK